MGWLKTGLIFATGTLLLMGAAIPLLHTGPLSGRTIVIDPGHGGRYDSGAISKGGLKEKDVNLQVSLRVGDLLRKQGARVQLTRTTDAAVSASDSGNEDLKARADIANEARADLFLSIHHNDTTVEHDPRNETQVYWRLEDNGPSRDFATLLLPKLAIALHQPRRKLIPGNFAVLRHCRRPAILGEGAYLSNPDSAAFLATPNGWQIEAEAYVAAIQAYFERGTPLLGPATVDADDRIQIPVTPEVSPIKTVQLWVDDKAVDVHYVPGSRQLTWQPPTPLANGVHRIRALARNEAGNASSPLETMLAIARAPASVTVAAVPPVWNPSLSSHALLTAHVEDATGKPVADGTQVRFSIGGRQATAATRAGKASAFVPWSSETQVAAAADAGNASANVTFQTGECPPQFVLSVAGQGSDVPAAVVSLDGAGQGSVDAEGRLAVTASPGRHGVSVTAPGYEPWNSAVDTAVNRVVSTNVILNPKYGGVLLGRHVMLDPLTVLEEPDYGRKTMTVAKRLQALLQDAGATTVLSRQTETNADPDDRVRQAGRLEADLYVGFGLGDGLAQHYYASSNGARLATLLHEQLGGIAPAPEASYLLSHTPCPALIVRSPLLAPEALADAVFTALRQYFATAAVRG